MVFLIFNFSQLNWSKQFLVVEADLKETYLSLFWFIALGEVAMERLGIFHFQCNFKLLCNFQKKYIFCSKIFFSLIFALIWILLELIELCAKCWNICANIHGEINCQSWLLLTPFFNFQSHSALAAFGVIEDSINFIHIMWLKVELFRSRRFTRNTDLGFLELFSQKYQIYFK